MASIDEKLETFGELWDSLSTGKKWGLVFLAVSVLIAAAGTGFWFGDKRADSRVASADERTASATTKAEAQSASAKAKADAETARYERKITELERKLKSERATAGYRVDVSYAPPGNGKGLPDLESAPRDKSTLGEFGLKLVIFRACEDGKTSIQKKSPYQQFIGRRFDWTGFVKDVWVAGKPNDSRSSFGVKISSDKDGSGFGVATCYFHNRGEYRTMLETAQPGQRISVAGVLDSGGNLTKCKLLQLGSD